MGGAQRQRLPECSMGFETREIPWRYFGARFTYLKRENPLFMRV